MALILSQGTRLPQTPPAAGDSLPTGSIIAFAGQNPPSGFLKCNGAAISRLDYAGLFGAIGTIYGAGDGTSTFNLPDLRGEFIRGWDDGRGIDVGRAIGSAQLDQMQRIMGSVTGRINRGVYIPQITNGAITTGFAEAESFSYSATSPKYPSASSFIFDSKNSADARTSEELAGETRSRNIALPYIIKF